MTSIVKSSIYRLKISKLYLYSAIVAVGLGIVFYFLAKMNLAYDASYTNVYETIRGDVDNWVFMGFMIIMFIIISLIGNDFKDKTIYYEVMGGHSRTEVILGRALASGGLAWLVWSIMGAIVLLGCREEYMILFNERWQLIGRLILASIGLTPYIAISILGAFISRDVLKGFIVSWSFFAMIQSMNILVQFKILQEDVLRYFLVKRIECVILQPISEIFCAYVLGISILETFILMALANIYFSRVELR